MGLEGVVGDEGMERKEEGVSRMLLIDLVGVRRFKEVSGTLTVGYTACLDDS